MKTAIKHTIYVSLFFLVGIIQLIDFHIFHHDPSWHFIFYLFVIPIINFVFSFVFIKEEFYYIYPTTATMFTVLTFLFFGNGGAIEQNLRFSILNVLTVTVPAFLSPIVGIAAARSKKINALLDKIKFKMQKRINKNKIEVIPPNRKNFINK